jgi:ubiquinone biosynthesis protein COQ4
VMNANPVMPQNAIAARFFARLTKISNLLGANASISLDLNKMRSLPQGSFGRAWADFIDRNDLQPLTKGPKQLQQHDGVHVITGYGADSIGEAELQAFLLGAQFKPRHLLLMLGILRQAKTKHQQGRSLQARAAIWSRLHHAYQRGREADFNVDNWQPEPLLELPLTEVRNMFKV